MSTLGRLTLASIWLGLTVLAHSESPTSDLTPHQKVRLIKAIGKKLSHKAYAFETDFSHSTQLINERQQEIEQASTKEELAKILGEALNSFDLSHLGVFAPSTVKRRRAGKRTGMGITIHPLEDGGGLISYVLANSPAERCGLKKGDLLTSIDQEPLIEIKQLAGDLGQKRHLNWKRDDTFLSCEIEYAAFSLSEPSSMKWLRDDVALLRIQSFLPRFYKAGRINTFFRKAKDAKGIVIDLRNNRGGLSFYSKHLASKLAKRSETFAHLTNKKGKKSTHPLPFSKTYSGKIVILVDSLSASAADIVPAFVSENELGIVIGQRTAGALQLARNYPLPYGFQIYLPIAEMLTPNGKRLEGVGFTPDRLLTLEETIDDEQILKIALETIDSP